MTLESCGAGGRIEVDVPTGSIAEPAAETFEGVAELRVAVSDPENGNSYSARPGLRAGLVQAAEPLDILAFAELHLSDPTTGDALQIADGATLTIRISLPEARPDEELEVFYFDPETNEWTPDGAGSIIDDGATYQYVTTHLSTFGIGYRSSRSGCLQVDPVVLEELRWTCSTDEDCPLGPDGNARACVLGQCGCGTDAHCPPNSICTSNTCTETTCSGVDSCRDGLDDRPLQCIDGACQCVSDHQCPGDLDCVDGQCRQRTATVDVYVNGRFVDSFSQLGECWTVPPGEVTLRIRHVNSFSIAAASGAFPTYEYRYAPSPPVSVPERDDTNACSNNCLVIGDPTPITLAPTRAGCIAGRVLSPCGEECNTPIEAGLHGRVQGDIASPPTWSASDGEFCMQVPIDAIASEGEIEITSGLDYPTQGYFTATLTPSPPAGGRSPDRTDPAWPFGGGCENVGSLTMTCIGGNCTRVSLSSWAELVTLPPAAPIYRLQVQAQVFGPLEHGYFELFGDWYRARTPLQRSRTFSGEPWSTSFTVESPGYYLLRFVGSTRGQGPISKTAVVHVGGGSEDYALITVSGPRPDLAYWRLYDGSSERVPVRVEPFQMKRHEVTQGEYQECMDAGRCTPPLVGAAYDACVADASCVINEGSDCTNGALWNSSQLSLHPVSCVTWQQAQDYRQWIGRRLPTDAEWEIAAASRDYDCDRCTDQYPWPIETTLDCDTVNIGECPVTIGETTFDGHTAPVGSHPLDLTLSGLLDYAGNVAEWTGDWFDSGYYDEIRFITAEGGAPPINPRGPTSGTLRTVRGAGFGQPVEALDLRARGSLAPRTVRGNLGFRCAGGVLGSEAGERCDTSADCGGYTYVCFEGQCVYEDQLRVSVGWDGDTDVDLELTVPALTGYRGAETIPGLLPTVSHWYLEPVDCSSDLCRTEGMHVESISWRWNVAPAEGTYRVRVLNRSGRSATDFRIVTNLGHEFTETLAAAPLDEDVFTFVIGDWDLAVTTSGTGSGTVMSTPDGIRCGALGEDCTHSFADNLEVSLAAIPTSDSTFIGWTDDACAIPLVRTDNLSCTAEFVLDATADGTLEVTVARTGTVTSAPTGIECTSEDFSIEGAATCANDFGEDTVTLEAMPNASFGLTGTLWYGDCDAATATTCDVSTGSSAKSVIACFHDGSGGGMDACNARSEHHYEPGVAHDGPELTNAPEDARGAGPPTESARQIGDHVAPEENARSPERCIHGRTRS